MYNSLNKITSLLFFSLLFFLNSAVAAPVVDFKSNELAVKLNSEVDGIFKLTVTSLSKTRPLPVPVVLELEGPNRLVLDLPEFVSKSSKSVNISGQYLSSIRMGVHADKTRFVIDIKAGKLPEYQLTKDPKANSVYLEFVFSDTELKSEKRKNQDEKLDEKVFGRPLETPSPKITLTTTTSTTTTTTTTSKTTSTTSSSSTTTTTTMMRIATTTTSLTTSTVALGIKHEDQGQQTGKEAGSAAEVKAIFFEVTENTRLPAVAFEVPGLKSYALNKITEELFELVLDNSYLSGKHLELPQFPPDSFKGFSVINASEDKVNKKVIVKIYVEEGTKLLPYFMSDQLWVKVGK